MDVGGNGVMIIYMMYHIMIIVGVVIMIYDDIMITIYDDDDQSAVCSMRPHAATLMMHVVLCLNNITH